MTDTFKVLGQSFPSAATLTTLYTVPALTSTTASSITVCNQSSTTADSFRISIQVAAAADTSKQYIYYNLPLAANDTFIATIGATLATTDVVKCYSSGGLSSFNLFGVEVT